MRSSDAYSSYAFRSAVETSTGAAIPARGVGSDLLSMPQAERVRTLSKQLSTLYQSYDAGRISLDAFRASLRDYGIVETPEATRLLLQGGQPTFTSLFRALQAEVHPGVQAAVAAANAPPAGPSVPSAVSVFGPGTGANTSRKVGPRPGEKQLDPITGQGDPHVIGPGHEDRRALVSPFNTAIVGNILAQQHDHRKAREDLRHEQETGAGECTHSNRQSISEHSVNASALSSAEMMMLQCPRSTSKSADLIASAAILHSFVRIHSTQLLLLGRSQPVVQPWAQPSRRGVGPRR